MPAGIAELRDTLLRVERIRRWFPVSFEVAPDAPARLAAGDELEARTVVLEQTFAFRVGVPRAENRRIRVELNGFTRLVVDAGLRPGRDGTRLEAEVTIEGRDLLSGLATAAVIAAARGGGIDQVANRIAAEARRGARASRRRRAARRASAAGRG